MAESFLNKVAVHVLDKHSAHLHRLCLVTPNRRAGLFLKKYFAENVSKAIWAPDVLSMEDFIGHISDVTIQEPVSLLLEFYETYCALEKEQAEPLEEFLKWAPMLMKDFNDIDAHLDEPDQLFNNVLDVKKIEAWNPDGQDPSEFQKKYLHFFEKMSRYHKAFSSTLKEKRTAYQGLAYRMAARAIKSEEANLPWQHILFTGFNALNEAEETIIRTLIKNGVAEIIWDADKYYLDNKNHEAGLFLRKYRNAWGIPAADVEDNFSVKSKNIKIYGVAKNVNQAKLAGSILSTMDADSFTSSQSALVLASEDLLLPVINSIPANVEKLNITMGFPLRKTPVYGLFDAVFQLHITTLRMGTAREEGKTVFYHKDVVKLFRHPGAAILWKGNPEALQEMLSQITASNKAFLSFSKIASCVEDKEEFVKTFGFIFESFVKHPSYSLKCLKMLSEKLDEGFRNKAQSLEIPLEKSVWFTDFEALFPLNVILRKLEDFIARQMQVQDVKTQYMLFQSLARESKLALVGEPLRGLQVMGMLETRNLDFKNLIILSANENILPAAKSAGSLIPFDVKAGFGIPVYKEKDAVFAYHFYRLIQRAENIHIIYNTQTQDLGSSEKSRFITQMQMELPAWNPSIKITETIVALPPAKNEMDHEILIPKDAGIMKIIREEINKKGFSPSTLSHYIRCSLFFYFRHIAAIEESKDVEETLEANTLGTVIHEVLQNLYEEQALNGKVLNPSHIDNMFPRVEPLTRRSFQNNYPEGDLSTGKNLLLVKVALRYVNNFLAREKAFLQELKQKNKYLTYIEAEKMLYGKMDIEQDGERTEVNFKGFADRIDSVDGQVRVIDYKTGKVETKELKINDWDEVVSDANKGKSFQLMMYAMLYRQTYNDPQAVIPGIFSLRNVSSGLMAPIHPGGKGQVDQASVNAFEHELEKLMGEIFNSNIPFKRTDQEDNCKNCEFRIVCNR